MPMPMTDLDALRIQFDARSLVALKLILGFILFGIALDIRPADLRNVLGRPRLALVGLASQYVVFPLVALAFIAVLRPQPSLALGLMLIATLPGGNISNYMVRVAGGNTALSISLTALAELTAFVFTPLMFGLLAPITPGAAALFHTIRLDPVELFLNVLVIVIVPVLLGMTLAQRAPALVRRIEKPVRIASLLFFVLLVVVAIVVNREAFVAHAGTAALWCIPLNALALASGYFFARVTGLPEQLARTIAFETGMKNTGLGLVLVFAFFDGLGGLALTSAFWGIWHCISGAALAYWWKQRTGQRLARASKGG
jgi:BASS family bile acid:Na+ symporter